MGLKICNYKMKGLGRDDGGWVEVMETIIVEPEIFINEYGREFIRYVWYDAEIAIINWELIFHPNSTQGVETI